MPCIVKTDGVEEEDSLAENTMREALHPLDQFQAFKNLHEQGLSIDDIAARFFVGAQVVRQRLKLAAASPKLLDLYVAEELSLDQLMPFCVSLASNPQAAFLAATHALALNAFYSASSHSCLDLSERSVTLGSHAPGIGDSLAARTLFESFGNWQMRLPADPANLWSWLLAQDESARAELFALCAGLSVNALNMPWERRTGVLQHADQLAEHIALDMRVSWSATVESFFGKVTKAHILAAVREAKGDEMAEMISHLKKADMAAEAERLLQGTGWLPEVLRTPNLDAPALIEQASALAGELSGAQDEELPAFLEESTEGPGYLAAAE